MGGPAPNEVVGKHRAGAVVRNARVIVPVPATLGAFAGASAASVFGLSAIAAALAGMALGPLLAAVGVAAYASPGVELSPDRVELADGVIGSHDDVVAYDDVELVVRTTRAGDRLLGTETLLVRSGDDERWLWNIRDAETVARKFRERSPAPTEQVRAARENADECEEVDVSVVWVHWPRGVELPSDPVVSGERMAELLGTGVSNVDFDELPMAVTYNAFDDIGDLETVSGGGGFGFDHGFGSSTEGPENSAGGAVVDGTSGSVGGAEGGGDE